MVLSPCRTPLIFFLFFCTAGGSVPLSYASDRLKGDAEFIESLIKYQCITLEATSDEHRNDRLGAAKLNNKSKLT
jgi:hypothetical protein